VLEELTMKVQYTCARVRFCCFTV